MSVIEWRNTTPKALDELPLLCRLLVYVLLLAECAATGLFYGLVLGIGGLVFMGFLTKFKPKGVSLQRTTVRFISTYVKTDGK